MQKFIISIKNKTAGHDVVSPFTIDSLNGIGAYAERVSSCGCIVIIDSIQEETDFFELLRKFELSNPVSHEQK
jgi:hypothetical protein